MEDTLKPLFREWISQYKEYPNETITNVSWSSTKDIVSMRNHINQSYGKTDEFKVLWNERNKHLRNIRIIKYGSQALIAKHPKSVSPSFIVLALELNIYNEKP